MRCILKIIVFPICLIFFGNADASNGGVAHDNLILGLVATSTKVPMFESTTAGASMMTRKGHYARTAFSNFKLVYPNWFVDVVQGGSGIEGGVGNSISVKSWVEYPIGTYTPVTFGGVSPGIFADYTNNLSDSISVSIPNGALFYTWTLVVGSGGNNFPMISNIGPSLNPLYVNGTSNEGAVYGTSGVPTSPGVITDNNSGTKGYFPAAIIARTTSPSFYFLGDSRTTGDKESEDASLDMGNMARSVGPLYPYINGGVGGDRAASFAYSSTMRQQLAQYATAVIFQLATNDLIVAQSPLAVGAEAYENVIQAKFPGKILSRVTIEPITNSSNGWIDQAGQSGAPSAQLIAYNTWVRSSSGGLPFSDITLAVETAINSGFWVFNGTPNWATNDGLHCTNTGSLLIESSGLLNPNTLLSFAASYPNYPSLTLTPVGTPAYTTGKFSQALSSGSGNLFGIVPGVPPYTMEGWIKTSTATNFATAFSAVSMAFTIDGSGHAQLQTPDNTITTSSTVVTDGAWHHIAVTMTIGDVFTLYVDGASVATHTTSSINWLNVSSPFTIGNNGLHGANNGPWTGLTDEVVLWHTVKYTGSFTPPSAPYTGSESNLMGLWHLDGNLNGIRGSGGL